MNQRALLVLTLLASLALHVAVLPPALGLWEYRRETAKPFTRPAAREVTIPLAEVLRVDEEADKPERLPYARTTENQLSPTPPTRPDFQSDKDTLAATEEAPAPDSTLDLPNITSPTKIGNEVERREFRDAEFLPENPTDPAPPTLAQPALATPPQEGAVPDMEAPSRQTDEQPEPAKPEPGEESPPAKKRDGSADEETEQERPPEKPKPQQPDAPPSRPRPSAASPAPSTVRSPKRSEEAFQPQTREREMKGAAKQKADAAFNTQKTLIGEYEKQVNDAIDRQWRRGLLSNADFLTVASLEVKFQVDASGKVKRLEVVNKQANAVLVDITLKAIMEAPIPKMPASLVDLLEGGALPLTIRFHMQ